MCSNDGPYAVWVESEDVAVGSIPPAEGFFSQWPSRCALDIGLWAASGAMGSMDPMGCWPRNSHWRRLCAGHIGETEAGCWP